ncbi:MAG: shikimate kinase [Alphaproteobacteria bacterium]
MTANPRSEPPAAPPKPIVLVGMMGAGKTAVGRRLAARFGLPFVDADEEIETAAGCSIADIFAQHGEAAFRDGERRVIRRLLKTRACVLATGGGAFMDERVRQMIKESGISVWLKADLETLWHRVRRRSHRPLLNTENPKETLERLMQTRYPVYAGADITVESNESPLDETVERLVQCLERFLATDARS